MGGMFRSSEPLAIFCPYPQNAAGASLGTGFAGVDNLFIVDGGGNQVNSFTATYTFANVPEITGQEGAGIGFWIFIAPAFLVGKVPGIWSAHCANGGFLFGGNGSAQWGGWIDTVVSAATQCLPGGDVYDSVDDIHVQTKPGGDVYENAARARKMLGNRIDTNSTTNPTTLTLYEDDGVTPSVTRTIANADGTNVSPTQVLKLGRYV